MASTSPVLASGPGDCCVTGFKHEGTAVGKIITIGGIETYISEPKKATTGPKKIIIFLSDVFGPFFPNNEFIQDYFAESGASIFYRTWWSGCWWHMSLSLIGYIVLGPDYFFGDYMHNHTEPEFLERRDAWFVAKLKAARTAYPAWLSAVKEEYGIYFLDGIISCTHVSPLFKEVMRCIALLVSVTHWQVLAEQFSITSFRLLLRSLVRPRFCSTRRYSCWWNIQSVIFPEYKHSIIHIQAAIAHPSFLNEAHFTNIISEILTVLLTIYVAYNRIEPVFLSLAGTASFNDEFMSTLTPYRFQKRIWCSPLHPGAVRKTFYLPKRNHTTSSFSLASNMVGPCAETQRSKMNVSILTADHKLGVIVSCRLGEGGICSWDCKLVQQICCAESSCGIIERGRPCIKCMSYNGSLIIMWNKCHIANS